MLSEAVEQRVEGDFCPVNPLILGRCTIDFLTHRHAQLGTPKGVRPGPRTSQQTHPADEPSQPRARSASGQEAATTTTISVAPEVELREMHARSARHL